MTPQELKASVLLYALQGKLVPHDPTEGTGHGEIEKMQRHKEHLQKAKEIKNEKPLPPVTDDEMATDIPDNWCWERIGNIGSWSAGATPSRTNPDYYGGDVPWLKTGDLNDGTVTSVPEYITDLALQKTSVRLNPAGSVLMAMYGATIGKLGILAIPMTTNQACCACIPYDGMLNKYLFYFLMGNRLNFIKMGEGGAQPNISKEKIVNFPIAIPPLAEQQRIVAKLEEILPLIDRYEAAWNKLEEFNKRFPVDMQKSILQMAIQGKLVPQLPEEGTGEELFQQIQAEKQAQIKAGKIKKEKPLPEITENEIPFDVPSNWKWVRLIDFCKSISDGDHQPPPQVPQGVPFLVISNVSAGSIDFSNTRHVPQGYFDALSDDRVAEKGDILFTVTGSYGIPIKVDCEQQFCFQRHIALLKLLVDWDYLYFALISPVFKAQCDAVATGTAQKTVGLKSLRSMLVPLPPIAEQKRIVAKLEEILPLCDRLK